MTSGIQKAELKLQIVKVTAKLATVECCEEMSLGGCGENTKPLMAASEATQRGGGGGVRKSSSGGTASVGDDLTAVMLIV